MIWRVDILTKARVLSLGDSISIGYKEALSTALAATATVERPEGNCSDSRMHLSSMQSWVGATCWDAIAVNCGLHDIKRATVDAQNQVPLSEYGPNLEQIVSFLKPLTSRLVWVTTTPVVDERHNTVRSFHRYTADVLRYNSLAAAVMHKHGIAVCDLQSWVMTMGKERIIGPDGVHFTPEGYKGAGEFLAAFLLGLLG